MGSSIDIRVPPIFQSHQQLGDFVMPTSSYNSFKEPSFLRTELCEGMVGDIPVCCSLPGSTLCQQGYFMHDPEEMEHSEDLKLYEQPLPTGRRAYTKLGSPCSGKV